MINLNLLRVFHITAKLQSVTRASEELFITQPAVTKSLKNLERLSPMPLFRKKGRSIALTEHGRALLSLTSRLFDVVGEVEAYFNHPASTGGHVVRLGLPPLYERYEIITILNKLALIAPQTSISIFPGSTATLLEMLRESVIDFAIVGESHADAGMCFAPYKKHEGGLIIPAGHRLFGNKYFTREDVCGERLILKEKGSTIRNMADTFFRQAGLTPYVFLELSNIDAILNVIIQEKCLTFLPDFSLRQSKISSRLLHIAKTKEYDFCFSTFVAHRPLELYIPQTRELISAFMALAQPDA